MTRPHTVSARAARRLSAPFVFLLLLVWQVQTAYAYPPLAALKAQLQTLSLPYQPDTLWFAQGVPNHVKPLSPQQTMELVVRPLFARYGEKALGPSPAYQTALLGIAHWGSPKHQAKAIQMLTAQGSASAKQPELRHIYAVGTLELRPGVESIVIYEDAQYLGAQSQTYYLLNYHPSGVLIDGIVLASRQIGGGNQTAFNGEVSDKGLLLSSIQRIVSQPNSGKTRVLLCDADRRLSILSDGRMVLQTVDYLTYTGIYVDSQSGEQLQFVQSANGLDVAYYAGDGTATRKLWITRQEPDYDRLTVRFAGSDNDYALAFGTGRQQLICTNPDGTKQVFIRKGDF